MNEIKNLLSINIDNIIENNDDKINGLSNINENLSIHYLIYQITNINTNQYYIGQHITENPLDKYMGSGQYLNKAKKLYGLSSFKKTILFDYNNFHDMNYKEKELVQLSNCYPYNKLSYNLKEGGSNGRLSKKSILKISKTKQEFKKNNPKQYKELCHKLSISHKGLLIGEKHPMFGKNPLENMSKDAFNKRSKKISIKNKITLNNKSKEEWEKIIAKRKITINNRTPEEKQRIHEKLSKANSGKNNGMYGKHLSEETKKKISKKSSGKNNGMYGKNLKNIMTIEMYTKMLDKRRNSMIGRKVMIKNGIQKKVKPDNFQIFLNDGWVFKKNNSKFI